MDNTRFFTVWTWCSEAYLRHGRKLQLPKGTEPSKTYQWRYVTAISKKFDEWELSDDAAKKFIDIAVSIAKEQNVLHKGLAVLHQSNMLERCYERLGQESDGNGQTLDSLRHINAWLAKKIGTRNMLGVLLSRENPDGFCNLVMWYQASRLTPLYLSLSRSCLRAIATLNRDHPDERGLLPKDTEIYLLRDGFLRDTSNLHQAREIFAQDWREPCLLQS